MYKKAELLSYKKAAERQILIICSPECCNKSFFEMHFLKYVMSRYFLNKEDHQTDDLDVLTEISLAKTLGIDKNLVKAYDQPGGCTGATSVMSKKALLFMAIQRDLEIKLAADELAKIKTLNQLTTQVWQMLKMRKVA